MPTWLPMAVAGAVLVAVLFNVMVLVWLSRRPSRAEVLTQRLDRLTNALSLLTDTTEAGLTAMATELQQVRRWAAPQEVSTRTATAERIALAARHGDTVGDIAKREALSESEVRLHLALVDRPVAGGGTDADMRA